jgi:chromosome segregation protein
LDIVGFKSFPDKTTVEFQTGITGIVGPNGCGKSNIVDAIRWVMGEMSAKHLRGKSMEDVIFSGTEKRPSTGMAEVTLVFSCEDGRVPAAYAGFSEISVRRRLYRSGESEYSINNVNCRLKDIYDLFLGTGVGVKAYSIIEQGMIGQVITAKPEQRRMILEEAAGISKFKSRKEAALRKIEATRGNLLRLADIIRELKRQIDSLDRQARKAERYRELESTLREIELHLSSLDYLESSTELNDLESAVKGLEEREAALAAKVSESENIIENHRLTLVENERRLMHSQEVLYEKNNSLQLHQAGIDHKTREIETLGQQNETASREIEVVKDRLSRLEESTTVINESQLGIDLELATAQETFSQLEKRLEDGLQREKSLTGEIEGSGENTYHLLKEISDKSGLKESLSRRKVDLAGRIGRDQAEIDEIDRLLKAHQGKMSQLHGDLGEVKQLKLDLVHQTGSIESTLSRQKGALADSEAQLGQIKDALSFKRSRLKSLIELETNFEGYKEGVRNVMMKRRHGENKDVLGTIADIVETDTDYESAVSAVLGEKLQYVVVHNQEAGLEALQYLKTESSGRLTCVPMEVRESETSGSFAYGAEAGVLGPLKKFVRVKGDYDRISNYLFSNVYLVESLKQALQIWNSNGHSKTLVTMDGEVVDAAGVVSGGSSKGATVDLLEKKREIKELQVEVAALESSLRQKTDEVDQTRSQLSHLETSLEALKRDSHSEELKIVHQEQDLNHLKTEVSRLTERRDKLSLEISAAMQEESEAVQEIETLEEKIKALEIKRTEEHSRQNGFKEQLNTTRRELEGLRGQLLEARSKLTLAQEKKHRLESDLQRLADERSECQLALEEKRQAITQANSKIGALKQEIEESRSAITGLVTEIQDKEQSGQTLKETVARLQAEVQDLEARLRDDRRGLEGSRLELNQKIRGLSEGRTKVQVLREQILERYHVDLAEIAPRYAGKPIDRETEAPRARELREKLEKMGTVNLGAIEEYEELKQRYEFLDKQYQDLEASLEGLLKALQKVNRTTKKRLQESFDRVNQLFQEVFPKLFKGGHAELRLTDPENILESGVDMVAQPPGKKLQNVTLLSGGEKALTAISLVFAIFLLKPSPFCLLDEVDAPLDDVNIERFNEMVRSMVERSQFILITHNKRTMEMADVLYGITMEQAGVSKMVSVNLN